MKRFKYAKIGDKVAYISMTGLHRSNVVARMSYALVLEDMSLCPLGSKYYYYYRNGRLCKQLPFLTLLKRILHLDKSEYINIKLYSESIDVPKIKIDSSINIKIN